MLGSDKHYWTEMRQGHWIEDKEGALQIVWLEMAFAEEVTPEKRHT